MLQNGKAPRLVLSRTVRLAVLVLVMVGTATSLSGQTLDITGPQHLYPRAFGWPGLTVGQTFTAPGSSLLDFTFWVRNYEASGVSVGSKVATWDTETGSYGTILWLGKHWLEPNTEPTAVRFDIGGGLPLSSGSVYVAFLTASPSYQLGVPYIDADVYSGGMLVQHNQYEDGGPESGQSWSHIDGTEAEDVWNFQARFSGGGDVVPEPAVLILLGTGLFGVGLAFVRRERHGPG